MSAWNSIRPVVYLHAIKLPTANPRSSPGGSRCLSSLMSGPAGSFSYRKLYNQRPTWDHGRWNHSLVESETHRLEQPIGQAIYQPELSPDEKVWDSLQKGTHKVVVYENGQYAKLWGFTLPLASRVAIETLLGQLKDGQTLVARVREMESFDVNKQMMLGGDELDRIMFHGVVLEMGKEGTGAYPVIVQLVNVPSPDGVQVLLKNVELALPDASRQRRETAVRERQRHIERRMSRYDNVVMSVNARKSVLGVVKLMMRPRNALLHFGNPNFEDVAAFDRKPSYHILAHIAAAHNGKILRLVGMQDWKTLERPERLRITARLEVPKDAEKAPDGFIDFSRSPEVKASISDAERTVRLMFLTCSGEWVDSGLRVPFQEEGASPLLLDIVRQLARKPRLVKNWHVSKDSRSNISTHSQRGNGGRTQQDTNWEAGRTGLAEVDAQHTGRNVTLR